MAEYIDREDLIYTLHNLCKINCTHYPSERDIYCGMCETGEIIDIIKAMPSADVIPKSQYEEDRKEWLDRYIKEYDAHIKTIENFHNGVEIHGYWINEPDRYFHWHCSECGYVISGPHSEFHYCPKCGTKMEGDK